jgi:peptidoglycan/LPS O-acetylase OafA/YrhL
MQSIGYTLIAVLCACGLVLVLVAEKRSKAILRWAPLVYTGEIAYGLYILHTPAQWIARTIASQVVKCERGSTLHFVLAMLASYAAAAISWKFFESKILRLKEHFAG